MTQDLAALVAKLRDEYLLVTRNEVADALEAHAAEIARLTARAETAEAALSVASQPEAEPVADVRCNQCDWVGEDADLIATICTEDREPCRGCPNCGTDHYLMDICPTPAPVVPAEGLDMLADQLQAISGKRYDMGRRTLTIADADVISKAAAALRAQQPAAPVSGVTAQEAGWQPIETASNDASIIVAYDNGVVALIQADDNDYDWSPYRGYPISGIQSPTHWMPLPEPPALSALEGK